MFIQVKRRQQEPSRNSFTCSSSSRSGQGQQEQEGKGDKNAWDRVFQLWKDVSDHLCQLGNYVVNNNTFFHNTIVNGPVQESLA